MPNLLNQSPEVWLSFTQGDDVVLSLIAVDDSGVPVDISEGVFSTTILGANGADPVVFEDDDHEAGDETGTFTLTMSQAQSALCGIGPGKDILTDIVIDDFITTYRGANLLNVYSATPGQ